MPARRLPQMSDWLAIVTEPLAYAFMQRAMLVAIIVAAVCAVLSCFLVLKGWSLMGDAVSHAVLPGIVLAYVIGLPLILGAFVAGLTCAVLTGYLHANSRVKEDTVMGVVFSGMFAIGLVLFAKVRTDQHLDHILFGNLLGVSARDVLEATLIGGITLALVTLKRRDLVLYCFDPQHARAIGLPVRVIHYGLLVLLALTIVVSIKAVGVILVVAMLITPGATGFLLARRFGPMLLISLAVSVLATITGTLLSFHIDGATGPCIVLVLAAFFVLAAIYARWRAGRPGVPYRQSATDHS